MSDFHGFFMSKKRTMFKFLASAGFLFMYVNMIRDDMRDLYIHIYIYTRTYSFGNVYAYTSLSRYMHEFIYIYTHLYIYIHVSVH